MFPLWAHEIKRITRRRHHTGRILVVRVKNSGAVAPHPSYVVRSRIQAPLPLKVSTASSDFYAI